MSTDDDSSTPNTTLPAETVTASDSPKKGSPFDGDVLSGIVTTKDEQIAELQEKLTEQSDSKSEITFWLSTLCVVLADCLIFPGQSALMKIFLIVFEILVGIHFARKMGLEAVVVLLDTLRRFVIEHIKKED